MTNLSIAPQLPSDAELEQGLLGACLADNAVIDEVFSACEPDDFFCAPHAALAAAICKLHADGLPVTPLTLKAKIGSLCDEIGGHRYFASLASAAPSWGISTMARQLVELRVRRQAISACMDGAEDLTRLDVPVLAGLQAALDVADKASAMVGRQSHLPIVETIHSVLEQAENASRGQPQPFVPTGSERLDAALGALQASDLAIYAGRPGMGKSTMMLRTALAAVLAGRPAIVFSLEMTTAQCLHRIGCDLDYDLNPDAPLSYSWFRGCPTSADVGRLAEALRHVPELLEIRDQGDLTIQEIAALARGFAAKHSNRLGIVIIDYLQKVSPSDRYRGSKVQEVTEISGACKALAKRLGWPVVAGAQLSRGVEGREDKRPTLSDLRESGAIEQDADSVIGLYRPAYYVAKHKPASPHDPKYGEWQTEFEEKKHLLEAIILKNRHGAEDVLDLHCEMRASAIRDAQPGGVRL
ncbi:MAG: replicative DNA helicase [Rhizomicrobium sp.]